MTVSETIKRLRKEMGLTQKELAQMTGIPLRSIINYENSSREPNAKAMSKLEAFFGVNGPYLRGELDPKTYFKRSEDAQKELDYVVHLFGKFSEKINQSTPDDQVKATTYLANALERILSNKYLSDNEGKTTPDIKEEAPDQEKIGQMLSDALRLGGYDLDSLTNEEADKLLKLLMTIRETMRNEID